MKCLNCQDELKHGCVCRYCLRAMLLSGFIGALLSKVIG